MIKKYVRKLCLDFFKEELQPQITENKVANMENKIVATKQLAEIK